MMIILDTVIFVFLIESIYCTLRAQKDKLLHSENTDSVLNPQKAENHTKRRKVITIITDCLDGFTFLFFKIIGYVPVHFIRNFIYRYVFHMKIAKKAVIYYGLEARNPWNIEIGKGSIIGDRCILDARYGIMIGKNVNVSTGVWIWTLQHDVNSGSFGTEGQGGTVIIEDRTWISSRVSILPGIHIAKGCVIACGAVVTKNCDERFSILGGIPARIIGTRETHLLYEFDGKHRFFI